MPKPKNSQIHVKGTQIRVQTVQGDDYICLTDIAKHKNPDHSDDVIRNWLRNRSTVEFLGIWEQLNNPDFNAVEFDGIRIQTGLNSFVLTPKQWIEKTGAIGISSRAGRYGGTYAHKDIAFEFASWVSVEFKLYLIKVPRTRRCPTTVRHRRIQKDRCNRHIPATQGGGERPA